jgi:transcriptional regulator with GAF, ATPase, and Fis domain
LRVLQEKEIERVGSTETRKLNIRFVAATHRDLEEMVAKGAFRKDLYFRLNVFPIVIPPLRQRVCDIPSLVQHFLNKKQREMGLKQPLTLAQGAIDRLTAHTWPGNVRELENAVERAIILSRGGPVSFDDLPIAGARVSLPKSTDSPSAPISHPNPNEPPSTLNEVVSQHIRHVLKMTHGVVGGDRGAAALLNVNPSTLRKKMRKLGIPFGRSAD